MQEIRIGSIITANNNGVNKEYQVIDNSEINSEYPIAILDINNYKIVQTSCEIDYMNLGHYFYIDKEYKIIEVRHPKETLKEKEMELYKNCRSCDNDLVGTYDRVNGYCNDCINEILEC